MKRTKAKSALQRNRIKLHYVLDVVPGYGRVRCGRGFYYTDHQGKRVTELSLQKRFRALVIPPGWSGIWISPSKKGHLQATGIDEQGRKQYRYHPDWTSERQWKKVKRMVAFGKALPSIRRQMEKDMRHDVLTKEKVIAIALETTEETLIRIGDDQYLRKYGSHGLTTLRKKHVRISGSDALFKFRGKKGVKQEITIHNTKLVSQLAEMGQVKGTYLFQYYTYDGRLCRLHAPDVNRYIQQHGGLRFSSKDYRTWYASFWAFRLFARHVDYTSEQECRANIVAVLDAVSNRLGNTRAVCKQYYVADSIILAYKNGTLSSYLDQKRKNHCLLTKNDTEQRLLRFLDHVTKRMPFE